MPEARPALKQFLTAEMVLLALTILVGTVPLIISIFTPLLSPLEQAILAVIAGLAGAQMADHYTSVRREARWGAHERTQESICLAIKGLACSGLRPRSEVSPLSLHAAGAGKLLLIGRTLSGVMADTEFFHDLLDKGCEVRCVVIKAEACGTNSIDAVIPLRIDPREAHDVALDHVKAELQMSFMQFRHLRAYAETIGKADNLKVKQVNYISPLSFVCITNSAEEQIIVELMPYQSVPANRPHVRLSSTDADPHWYGLFKKTCERIWDTAEPWDPAPQ